MWGGWSPLCRVQSEIPEEFHTAVHVTLHSPGGHIVAQAMWAHRLREAGMITTYCVDVLVQDIAHTPAR